MPCAVLALLAMMACCLPGALAFIQDGGIHYYPDLTVYSQRIGGGGGSVFDTTTCDTSSTFDIINRIKVYTAEETMNGFFIETTAGNQYMLGTASCDSQELAFKHTADEVDVITSLSLWGNCVGTRLGGIKITTKSGQTLDVSMKCKDRCTEYNQPVGSGIPCGIFGSAGAEVDSLGFSFLRPYTRRQLRIDTITGETTEGSVYTLNGGNNGYRSIDNRDGPVAFPSTVTVQNQRTYSESLESTNTFKFSEGLEISFSEKLTVEGVFESQFGVKVNIGWEATQSLRTTRTTTDTKTFTVSDVYTCPPFSMCDFFDYVVEGNLQARYTGALVYTLDNGYSREFSDLGTYAINQGSMRRTSLKSYCCGTDAQCALQNKMPESPRVACDRPAYGPASALALSAGDVNGTSLGARSYPGTHPADISMPLVQGRVLWQNASLLAAPTMAGTTQLPAVAVTDCTASPDACPWVLNSTRALVVQQGPPGSGPFTLGEITPADLSRFVNSSLAAKSLVALSLYGCATGMNCMQQAEVKVVATADTLTCQPGAVLMTLRTKGQLANDLVIPRRAQNATVWLQVVGVSQGDQCVLQLRPIMPRSLASTMQPSSLAATGGLAQPNSVGDMQAASGLEGLACAIGMAKCAAVRIANVSACCQAMPPVPIIPQASCDCPSCFPGDAVVVLEGGVETTMDQLKIGDKVQVMTADGQLRYEPIYLFGHKDPATRTTMLTLEAESNTSKETVQLTLSPDHFVPVAAAGLKGAVMTRAEDVTVGDRLWAVSEQSVQQSAELFIVKAVTAKAAQGLFNPFTPAGTVVVNGVVASVHSEWFLDRFMDWLGATHLIPAVYQVILLPVYYVIYSVLGPEWVRYLDDKVDFATAGTNSPVMTLFGVWSCFSAAAVPMLIMASKVPRAGRQHVDI